MRLRLTLTLLVASFLFALPAAAHAAPADPHLTGPNAPAMVFEREAFKISGSLQATTPDDAQARVRVTLYQHVNSRWIIIKQSMSGPRGSAYASPPASKYLETVTAPWDGYFKVVVCYPGDSDWKSAAVSSPEFRALVRQPVAIYCWPAAEPALGRTQPVTFVAAVVDQAGRRIKGASIDHVFHRWWVAHAPRGTIVKESSPHSGTSVTDSSGATASWTGDYLPSSMASSGIYCPVQMDLGCYYGGKLIQASFDFGSRW